MNTERRQDKITKRWILYAPHRNGRPRQTPVSLPEHGPSDPIAHDPACPFCPGNEDQLPGIIFQLGGENGLPWMTRVVPNKYPAVVPEPSPGVENSSFYRREAALGYHEVIIESPRHDQHLVDAPPEAARAVLETYLRRYHDLRQLRPSSYPILFRNHGHRAGASLAHPHGQIVAPTRIPEHVRRREEQAWHYFEKTGHCVYCDIALEEQRRQVRIVVENAFFLAFVPFAAEVPYEVWILPRRHAADFGDITDEEAGALTTTLQHILCRLRTRLGDPAYNFVIHTASAYRSTAPHLHWYLRIVPRTTTPGGFEIGSGTYINPSLPEQDAADLRDDSPPALKVDPD